MPYRYLPDIAIADTAFEATGETREALFSSAADALTNEMVEDLDTVRPEVTKEVRLSNDKFDLLLFDFLEELIFLKDAEQLLLRVRDITITDEEGPYSVEAVLAGERLDPGRHALRVDVKAVTLHLFEVARRKGQWRALVVLDI